MINRPNTVTIDLAALAHNLYLARSLTSQGTKIMGIVKADAYGHGLLPVSRALESRKIDCLGVAHLYEALELRKGGIKVPIIILCGIRTREEAREVAEKGLTPVVFDFSVAEILDQECSRQKKRTRIHLKVDTGMGRLGISHGEIRPFIQRIMTLKNLDIEALMSHLSSADERAQDFTRMQIKNFEKAINMGRSLGLHLRLNNLANSAGIMAYKKAHFEMVRPGIMLYGGLPSPEFKGPISPRPVMHLKGKILQVRNLAHNTPVSYGRTYYTQGPRRVAIISTGYGDGVPRSLSNLGEVLIGMKRAAIVGTICMNLTVCDITDIGDVGPGDEAVFLGTQGQETISGDDIAEWAGTVAYEVFCSIGQRHKREYSA